MTPNQLAEARAWCEDCFEDYDPEATDSYILRVIAHEYDGGIAGFVTDTAVLA